MMATLPPPKNSEMLLSRKIKKERSDATDISELYHKNQELLAENSMMKRYLNSLLMPREYHWTIQDFTWSTRLYVSDVFCFAGTSSTITPPSRIIPTPGILITHCLSQHT